MNLNTVKAAPLCSCGGLAECPDKIMYLLNSQSAGNVGLGRLLERRGSNGVCVICLQTSLTTGVVNLRTHKSAGGMYLAHSLRPCGNLIVAPKGADDRVTAGVLGHTEDPR